MSQSKVREAVLMGSRHREFHVEGHFHPGRSVSCSPPLLMIEDLKRKLEIGSHSERLRAVRDLAEMGNRDACGLLELAVEDIDPQIQEEARRAIQANVYASGSLPAKHEQEAEENIEGQENLF